jgi:prolyl oligopeptidase
VIQTIAPVPLFGVVEERSRVAEEADMKLSGPIFQTGRGSRKIILLALFFLVAGASFLFAQEAPTQKPPQTRRDNVVDDLYGVKIPDPYRWLEDQNSPETRAWINAEKGYATALLDSAPGRARVRKRLSELMKVDTVSIPVERGGRYFFKRRAADQDQGVLYLRRGAEGKDESLVDPNPLSADHSTSVSMEDVSADGKLLAYGIRQGGQDQVAVHFLNVDTRQELPDRLPRGRYFGVALRADKTGVYYSRHSERGARVSYHRFGAPPSQDTLIFGKGYGPEKAIGVDTSDDARYLIITVFYGAAADWTEVYYQNLAGGGPLKTLVNDIPARFIASIAGDTIYVQTNWQAPKGRLLAISLKNPAREHWHEIIPQSEFPIDSFSPVGGRILVSYLENAASHVKLFAAAGRFIRDLALPSLGTVSGITGRWKNPQAFVAFDSFTLPLTIYRYDVATGARTVWARQQVPFESAQYEVEQVWYPSKDGTRVPMFLAHRKGLKPDGKLPTLMTGYGGFDISVTPYFSPVAAWWVEEGGLFALPNLRGGGEFGEAWHHAGMLQHKQNVFDDFIAAGEWLIKNHYTNPSKLAIMGASNGGLLVGAAITQRPDLYQAAVCAYPLLDMLRYQKFLLGRLWVPEYGSAENPQQFKYLYAYSPYQHVKAGTKYPAVLFITGDFDTRVAPLHARKMTAALQASTASHRPILLHYETEAGHTRSGMSVSKQIEQATDEAGFLLWQLGVSPGGAAR